MDDGTDLSSDGMAADVTWRIAFAPDARRWRYPLAFSGKLEWRVDGISTAEIGLPPLPPGHIVVPSFASPDSPDHRWALVHDDASCLTASFGRPVGQCTQVEGAAGLNVRIDYFETSKPISNARLRLLVDAVDPPRDYLVAVGVRPVRMAADIAPPVDTPVLDIPARSQTAAAQEEVRPRICSPTCVSMAMNHLGVDHAFDELVIAAYHRVTDLYGVWPQNIWAASRWGTIGAIETTVDWGVVERAVAGGHPLAASIAFEEGDLRGSAIPASVGHLVIVRGIQNNRVVVNDPAANDAVDVPRRYDADEFREAWLAARGVCYLFAVSESPQPGSARGNPSQEESLQPREREGVPRKKEQREGVPRKKEQREGVPRKKEQREGVPRKKAQREGRPSQEGAARGRPSQEKEREGSPLARMRYLIRFALLCAAAAMTSFGLAYWQHTGFTMEGFWLVDNDYRPHPVHILALGLAMIPTTIWEIFLLDAQHAATTRDDDA